MADSDELVTESEKTEHRSAKRKGGRSDGGGISQRDLEAAIAALPPERLQALAVQAQSGRKQSGSPKLSAALETVEAEEADEVIAACKEGLDVAKEKGPTHGDVMAPLKSAHPQLATAVDANSAYRLKDHAHSLRVCVQWLEARHGRDEARE